MNPLLPEFPAWLLVIALPVLAVWSAWRSAAGRSRRLRAVLAGLRGVAAVCILALLLNPGHWERPIKAVRAEWTVLLDRSRSMAWRDAPGGTTRFAYAATAAGRFAGAVHGKRKVRIIAFSRSPQAVVSAKRAEGLTPDGDGSDILGAVRAVLTRYQSVPERLAGVLVLSDGACVPAGDPDPVAEQALAMHVPLNVLPVGGPVRTPDIAVRSRRTLGTAFAGQHFEVILDVSARGCGPVEPEVRLSGPETDLSRRVRIPDNAAAVCRFRITAPAKAGSYSFTAKLPGWQGERNLLNNTAVITVQVLDTRLHVLLAEGLPHWDSKFIAQVLRRQNYIALTELYRLGPGRFRCIDSSKKTVSGTAFPQRIEDLDRYDIVILGKAADAFITGAVAEVVRAYLNDGGVLVFARGRPNRAAHWDLERMLPLVWENEVVADRRWRPTDLGQRVGLFGELLPGPGDPLWTALPPVPRLNRARPASPFSMVLAEAARPGGRTSAVPVLAVRRFGRGLCMSVNAEGLWEWDFFPREARSSAFYGDFWPALLRWALRFNDCLPGKAFALRAPHRAVKVGEPVTLAVLARHPNRNSGDRPLQLRIQHQGHDTGPVAAVPVARGVWEGQFSPSAPGIFLVSLRLPGKNGLEAVVRAAVQVDAPPSEDTDPGARPDFLRKLAEGSGGSTVSMEKLGELAAGQARPASPQDTTQRVWQPRWDRASLLLLIAFVLAGEWYMRRRMLLP